MEHKWIEEFYAELERKWPKWRRPADYKEKMAKLLSKQRKPIEHQYEGLTKHRGKTYE